MGGSGGFLIYQWPSHFCGIRAALGPLRSFIACEKVGGRLAPSPSGSTSHYSPCPSHEEPEALSELDYRDQGAGTFADLLQRL
jgi:hypothetical protein